MERIETAVILSILSILLAGCDGGKVVWWDPVPGQSALLCYEDGTGPGDRVRVFAAMGDQFIAIATVGSLEAEEVKAATRQAFDRRPFAVIGIVYRHRGNDVVRLEIVRRS